MGESPKGSIFASLRALEEVPEETPTASPVQQSAPPTPAQPAQPPTPQPAPVTPASNDAVKSVESRIEKMEQKIQEMGAVPHSPIPDSHLDRIEALEKKLQQMQERAIQAEVALREREKSQEAARRETEALLQNLAAQRRLEESDRQMKENLAYSRRRIEELEAKKPEFPTEIPQEEITRKIEEGLRPFSETLSRLELQAKALQEDVYRKTEEGLRPFSEALSRLELQAKALQEDVYRKTEEGLRPFSGTLSRLELQAKVLQEDVARKIEEGLRPLSEALPRLELQNENIGKMGQKLKNLENRVDSFFAYQAEFTQDIIENQKALAATKFQAQKTEEILKNTLEQYARFESWFRNRPIVAAQADSLHQTLSHFKKINEQTAAATKEELDKISSALSHLIDQEKMFESWLDSSPLPQKYSNPAVSNTPGKSEDIEELEEDFQKILSVLDSGLNVPPNK